MNPRPNDGLRVVSGSAPSGISAAICVLLTSVFAPVGVTRGPTLREMLRRLGGSGKRTQSPPDDQVGQTRNLDSGHLPDLRHGRGIARNLESRRNHHRAALVVTAALAASGDTSW